MKQLRTKQDVSKQSHYIQNLAHGEGKIFEQYRQIT